MDEDNKEKKYFMYGFSRNIKGILTEHNVKSRADLITPEKICTDLKGISLDSFGALFDEYYNFFVEGCIVRNKESIDTYFTGILSFGQCSKNLLEKFKRFYGKEPEVKEVEDILSFTKTYFCIT